MNDYEIAVLREALGDGEFGGWVRDPATRRTLGKAWEHRAGTERVELEPSAVAGYRNLRILLRDLPHEPWTVHAHATVRSGLSAILILIAYRLVPRRLGIDYQVGWKDGFLAGRVDGIREVFKAVSHVL